MSLNNQATTETKIENLSQNDKNTKDNVNIEVIIGDAIGQFGKYQLIGLLMFVGFMICQGPINTEYAFTSARITTRLVEVVRKTLHALLKAPVFSVREAAGCRPHIVDHGGRHWGRPTFSSGLSKAEMMCLIPGCDDENPDFAPPWILNAVPPSGSTFDDCTRYGLVNTSPNDTNATDVCPASMFDTSTIVKCREWVYANQDTIVYEFDLGCDEWRRSLVGSARTAGCFINLALTGFISDRFGRKPALFFNTINVLWIGMLRSFSNSYWMFFVLEFAETSVGFSGYTCLFLILLELFGSKYRLAIGACSSSAYSLGQMYLALLAWRIPYWRNLSRVIYTQQLLPITAAILAPESFRWLMVKQKYDKGINTLLKVAKFNGRSVSEKTLNQLKDEIIIDTRSKDKEKLVKQPWLPLLVWRHKAVLRRCLIAPMLWITVTLTTYGLSLNAVNLTGSRYLNYAAAGAAEIPGHWTAYYVVTNYGRKFLLMFAYWACAACMIASACVGRDHPWLPLTLSLLGKYCIALVGASIYVYTAEIFPTSHRHTLFSFCSMVGRVGSIIAPLTPALGTQIWSELPYVIFAACCATSGTLMMLMPETRGASLPDTMTQM